MAAPSPVNLIVLRPRYRETGAVERIDCTRFGSGAYSIPSSVEHLSFETNAKFVLAIETGVACFKGCRATSSGRRLKLHSGLDGRVCRRVPPAVSSASFRRRVRRFQCTPLSTVILTGSRTSTARLKVGSGNAAHINPSSSVSLNARYLGVTPQDIRDYKLPTHPAQRGRHQARQRRPQERSLLQSPQTLAEGHQRSLENGGARRAAGSGEVGTQLRHRGVSSAEACKPGAISALVAGCEKGGTSHEGNPAGRWHR